MVTGYPDFTLPVVHVGAITVEGSVSVLGTVEVKGAVTVSGTVSISGTVTVTGAVTVSGTVSISGTVEVTGSVTVSGTVSISGSVTVTGSVTVSGAVTIGTVAADNIVIDKLTVGAYTEDRRTLSNNGVTPSYLGITGDNRRGKYFPRGCRGFINTIDLFCKDAAAAGGTITVYLSPHPSMGYIATADVTVPAEGTPMWRSATFNRMWNYDSMFIFWVCSVTDVKVAFDAETPYDHFYSTDAGATWASYNERHWARAVIKAMTVGDLPVSGTINTIEIPSKSTTAGFKPLTVGPGMTAYDTEVKGSGELIWVFFMATAAVSPDVCPSILADGVEILFAGQDYTIDMIGYRVGTGKGHICKGVWDGSFHAVICNNICEFKRSLKIGYKNLSEVERTPDVAYIYKRIS